MDLEARVTRIEKHLGLKPYPQFTTKELITFVNRQQKVSASLGRKLESITFKAEDLKEIVPQFWTDFDSSCCSVVPNVLAPIQICGVSIKFNPSILFDFEIHETITRYEDWDFDDEDLL